jgi:hypothetical protein
MCENKQAIHNARMHARVQGIHVRSAFVACMYSGEKELDTTKRCVNPSMRRCVD